MFCFSAVQSSDSRYGFSFTDDAAASHPFGNMLPDEEDLLTGMMDDLDLAQIPDSPDDYDLFGSGGGMELDTDSRDGFSMSGGPPRLSIPSLAGTGTVTGEHPYGEHPSRTLFVRNINSNVEDSELKALFEVTSLHYNKLTLQTLIGYLLVMCGSNTVTLGRSTLLVSIGGLS